MERHTDVYALLNWYNPWGAAIPGYSEVVAGYRTLDQSRILGRPFKPIPHAEIAGFYRQADVSLFLSRCEAGTNLPLMESIACGVPTIATWETGHRDVLPTSPLNLEYSTMLIVKDPTGQPTGTWFEPSLDEVIDHLEDAYRHREALPGLGTTMRDYVKQFTWQRCARELLKALEG